MIQKCYACGWCPGPIIRISGQHKYSHALLDWLAGQVETIDGVIYVTFYSAKPSKMTPHLPYWRRVWISKECHNSRAKLRRNSIYRNKVRSSNLLGLFRFQAQRGAKKV